MKMIDRFYAAEDDLIGDFHDRPFFRGFSSQTDKQLKGYLVQKWFLSSNFVPWYDHAMNGLKDPEAREVLRQIILDETPSDAPSHREDLLADLEYIGIPPSQVLTAKPTPETVKALKRLEGLVRYSGHPDHDLRVMAALRTAGEVLVAEEYRHVVPELEQRFGLTPQQSRFYAPHFYHDRKEGQGEPAGSHTTSFAEVLERMIADEDKLGIAVDSAREAAGARLSFFDQFTPRQRMLKTARKAGLAAASLLLAGYLAEKGGSNEREEYADFLSSLTPAARQFFLDADQLMLERFGKTGERQYLEKAGTFEAVREVWGPGP